ncbi:MAG: Lrp/AsnC family transcriptional regulator [Candidatus Marinimicrobia bacterium]|nr:Lrp/AsnC family transcriptional regulator [Candidatus Neomarinimicrobiota bacterium]
MINNKNHQIMALLQDNSRSTTSEIATIVGLSIPAVSERIKKLVDAGYIRHFTTILDHKKLGFDLTAYITVVSSSSDHYEEVVSCAKESAAVLECHSVTGGGSHLLKVRVKNSTVLEKLLRDIQLWPGVARTQTMVVLSTYKEGVKLDLQSSLEE